MKRTYTTLPYIEYPVADGNFDGSRTSIDRIVLHSTAGTYQSAINWFGSVRAGTSAHYIISNKGELAAMLEEYNTAYHSGNYVMNQRSIGIEHEGYDGLVRSDKEYAMSAKLVADICKFYSIPCDSTHVIPHKSVIQTSCPTDLDVARIIREANAILTTSETATPTTDERISIFEKIKTLFNLDINCSPNQVLEHAQYLKDQEVKVKELTIRLNTANSANELLTAEVEREKGIVDNLNQQINDRNGNITKLTSEKNTLESQLKEAITQRDIANELAKEAVSLKQQIGEYEKLKELWVEKEKVYIKNIADLKERVAFVKSTIKQQLLKIYLAITK